MNWAQISYALAILNVTLTSKAQGKHNVFINYAPFFMQEGETM